jgi:protein-disulfide isomerase
MSWLYTPVDPRRDHILGPTNTQLSLVEYGDYECPYCGRAHLEMRAVRRHFKDELSFAFRNFPLTQMHPHAAQAAEAAEAAGAQGRFWEMHDMLYENQGALEYEDLLGYAQALRLDGRSFELALSRHTYLPRIRDDFFGGVRGGVNGTPCFFINGRRHDEAWDARSLIRALEAAREERPVIHAP